MTELRKTPLNAVHRASGAKMVAFGGWEMPVQYTGIIEEHRTVRRAVTREVLWNGNREYFLEHCQLWSEKSLFHWLFKTYWRYRRELPILFAAPAHAHAEIVRLPSPREAERWLAGVT